MPHFLTSWPLSLINLRVAQYINYTIHIVCWKDTELRCIPCSTLPYPTPLLSQNKTPLRWGFTWKKRTFCIACSNHSFNPNHNKLYITGKLILQRFWKRMFLCTASKSNLVPGCQRHYPQCKTLGYLRKDFSLQTSQTNKLLMLFQRIVPNCWYEWRILQNCKITCQKSHLKLNHQNVGDFSLIIFSPASPWQIPSFISIHLMSTNSPENFRSIA